MFYCMPLFANSCSGTCNFYELCPLLCAIFPSPRWLCHFSPLSCKLGRTETSPSGSSQTSSNMANKVCSAPSGSREENGSWVNTSFSPRVFHTGGGAGGGMGQGSANMSQNFLPFWIWIFLIGDLFGCCRPLTVFQSSYKVTLAAH